MPWLYHKSEAVTQDFRDLVTAWKSVSEVLNDQVLGGEWHQPVI